MVYAVLLMSEWRFGRLGMIKSSKAKTVRPQGCWNTLKTQPFGGYLEDLRLRELGARIGVPLWALTSVRC
ncbi:hypothetical protein Hdeb2414_s0220g00837851 [Helianthus debilis subsp. tardiflorus]